ncbi:MAG: hypothetical protein AAGF12_31920, partial [Myxococcota bacterium]
MFLTLPSTGCLPALDDWEVVDVDTPLPDAGVRPEGGVDGSTKTPGSRPVGVPCGDTYLAAIYSSTSSGGSGAVFRFRYP